MDGGREKTGAGRHSCMTAKVLIIDVPGDSARGMHKREPDPWPQQDEYALYIHRRRKYDLDKFCCNRDN